MRFHVLLCGCLALPKTSDGAEPACLPTKPEEVEQASAPPPAKVEVAESPGIDTMSSTFKPADSITSDVACQHGRVCSGPGSYLYTSASNPRTSSSRALVGGVEYHSFFVNPLAEGSHEEGAHIAYAGASIVELDKGLNNPLAEEFENSFSSPPDSPCKAQKAAIAPAASGEAAGDSAAPAAPGTPTRGSTSVHSCRGLQTLTCHQPWRCMEQRPPMDLEESWEPCTSPFPAGMLQDQQGSQPALPPAECEGEQTGAASVPRAATVSQSAVFGAREEDGCEELLETGCGTSASRQRDDEQGHSVGVSGSPSDAQVGVQWAPTPATPAFLPRLAAVSARSLVVEAPRACLSGDLPRLPELLTLEQLPELSLRQNPGESQPQQEKPLGQAVEQQQRAQESQAAAETALPGFLEEGGAPCCGKGAIDDAPAVPVTLPAEEFAPCTPQLLPREPSAASASPAEGTGSAQEPQSVAIEVAATVEGGEIVDAVGCELQSARLEGASRGHCYVLGVPVEGCDGSLAAPSEADGLSIRRCLEASLQQEVEAMEAGRVQPVPAGYPSSVDSGGLVSPAHATSPVRSPRQQQQQQFALPALPEYEAPPDMPPPAAASSPAPTGALCPDPDPDQGIADTSGGVIPVYPQELAAPTAAAVVAAAKPVCGLSLGGALMQPGKAGGSFGGALERVRAPLSTPGAPPNEPGCSISGLAMTRVLIRQLGLLPGPWPGTDGAALPLPSPLAVAAAQQARLEALARLLPVAGKAGSSDGGGGSAGESILAPSPFASARHAAATALQYSGAVEAGWPAAGGDVGVGEAVEDCHPGTGPGGVKREPAGLSHRLSYATATSSASANKDAAYGIGQGEAPEVGLADGEDGLGFDYSSSNSSSSCFSFLNEEEDAAEGPRVLVISTSSLQNWMEPYAWTPLRERYGSAAVAAEA